MISRRLLFFIQITGIIFLCLSIRPVLAAPVQEPVARKAALGFISSFSPLRSENQLTLIHAGRQHPENALRAEGLSSLYYIYNVGNRNGYVIISGEDKAYPVLAYATDGDFHAENMPENLAYWLDFYEREALFAIEQNEDAPERVRQEWQHILSTQQPQITAAVLLSTVNWDQGAPYNLLCPKNSAGENTVTGCVATAMGIVMKYHNWPEKGKGSNSYQTRTDSIPVSASFETVYNWSNMAETYNEKNSPWNAQQSEAVSTLLYHCGVAVNMDYTSSSSGAYTNEVLRAMSDHFGYDKSMTLIARDLYSASEWTSLIREELDYGYPVIYGGATKDLSGHLFVIDGYSVSGDYFHVNWGWNGYSNGYYRLSSLEPSWQGIGGSKDGEGFSYSQDAIVGLEKTKRKSYTNNELYFLKYYTAQVQIPGWNRRTFGLLTDVPRIVRNEPFVLYHTFIFDYGRRDFEGELAVMLEDKNKNPKQMLCRIGMGEGLPAEYIFWEEEGIPLLIEDQVDEGDCIALYYRPYGYEWRPMRGETGTVTRLPVYEKTSTSTSASIHVSDPIRTEINNGQLVIHSTDPAQIRQVRIYTPAGKELFRQTRAIEFSPFTIDLSRMKDQLILLHIELPEKTVTRKLLVN